MKKRFRVVRTTLLVALAITVALPAGATALPGEALHYGANSALSKRKMEMEDLLKFDRVTDKAISPDGSYVAVVNRKWRGRNQLSLFDKRGRKIHNDSSVADVLFAGDSQYLLYRKGRKNKFTLHLYHLSNGDLQKFKDVKSYISPRRSEDHLTLLKSDSTLVIVNLPFGKEEEIATGVGEIAHSLNRTVTLFNVDEVLYRVIAPGFKVEELYRGEKNIEKLAVSNSGNRSAFIADKKLYVSRESGGKAAANDVEYRLVTDNASTKGRLSFAPRGARLFFTLLNPKRAPLDEDEKEKRRPDVHIWNWLEKEQFPTQMLELEKERDRGFFAVYSFKKGSYYAIEDENFTTIRLVDRGNSSRVIGMTEEPYLTEKMWRGSAIVDVYLFDTYRERKTKILEGVRGLPRVSPAGSYLYWYSRADSSWISYSIESGEKRLLSPPQLVKAYDELDDRPDHPTPYGAAGWSKDDSHFYFYDKYDLWSVDPASGESAKRVTIDGAENNITYRYLPPRPRMRYIVNDEGWLLHGFNNETKGFGYYHLPSTESRRERAPRLLYGGDCMLSEPLKARKSDAWLFTRETFQEYPELRVTRDNFASNTELTNFGEYHDQFFKGSAELVKWTTFKGLEVEGVLFKPEGWDPNKRYPVIVNFYEKRSKDLHLYRIPSPHRSTIDYHWYLSNGYVIFHPDIHYTIGYPGESAYDCVISGVEKLIEDGIADPKRIGAQGHSWGGYQVAYLATKSNHFAAIESGAPVVNMYSAYGGIRWGSGKNRSFQYEHQQSRIGKTIWEDPKIYYENSPLFFMDKVETPILIMHNDKDGHVPWEQGIEYFVALKRLGKPVWLLNYTGEIHWPQKLENRIDFQKRMRSFFDHYLLGTPVPKWMSPGVTAIELERDLAY